MEVQIREKCHWCNGTGERRIPCPRDSTNTLRRELCADCNAQGYILRWIDIGELAHEMERAKIVWEDEQGRNRSW